MRIHRLVTFVLLASAAGAVLLAGTVAVLLVGLETAALAYGGAANQHRTASQLAADARMLVDATQQLHPRSSQDAFTDVDRTIERSRIYLRQLRPSEIIGQADLQLAKVSLGHTATLAATRSIDVQHPDELERLKASARDYAAAIDRVQAHVHAVVEEKDRGLTSRRRRILLVITLLFVGYLAAMEHLRRWTRRQLVLPVRALATAARRAMKGAAPESMRLEHVRTEELNTLARMIGSFSAAVDTNVAERTAQLQKQQEILEQEVRERRRAEQAIRFSALRDKLTGLANRELLVDRVGRCVERARRREGFDFALLHVDLDQFSDVNHEHGQLVGDQAVVAVAERFRRALDEVATEGGVECTTLARLGGDEFSVLLDGLPDRGLAHRAAEALQRTLSRPLRVRQREMFVTASIGMAFGDGCEAGQTLLRNAEAAMHYAKASGRGQVVAFRQDMHEQVTAGEERGRRLRQALERGEFSVVYQPIISLRHGRLSGFEALARWTDPGRGAVSPVEFIADAEQTGVIVELGRWVLEQACAQLRRWQDALPRGERIAVSVNVSRQQLATPDVLDDVRRALESAGVDATSLKLEITESVIMDDPDAVVERLHRLKQTGVEIHMDDFGTGYSSLSYLHRLPIDVLKIDRSFMDAADSDHDSMTVVQTVVALARSLDMRVTVEGVETEAQLQELRGLDCDYGQGFFFSKPLTPDAALHLLRSERRWGRPAA